MARHKRRPLTWVILVMNVLFVIWIIAGIAGNSDNCNSSDSADLCRSATDVGTGIAVFLIVMFAAFMNVILGVIWLVTRKPRRVPDTHVDRVGTATIAPAPPGTVAGWRADPS